MPLHVGCALWSLRIFLEAIELLGPRAHALWIQLPGSFAPADVPVLDRFLRRDATAETVEGWQHWVDVTAGWLREGRTPTVFVHTPDNVDAPLLARRFHDAVRARIPGLEPLPEPVPVEPLTLF